MKRRIAFLDVTAMTGTSVCVAGVDLTNNKCVRLSLPSPQRAVVKRYGIKPGEVFEIDYATAHSAHAPHVEDAKWNSLLVRRVETFSHDKLVSLVGPLALGGVVEAFGPPLRSGGSANSSWEPGKGARSLATIRTKSVHVHRSGDRPRLTITDATGDIWKSVPIQDLCVKLHTETCDDCRDINKLIPHLQQDFEADGALIRVGITRPFAPDGDAPVCWLQVTNIFARPRTHFV